MRRGLKLVVSDADGGLKTAITNVDLACPRPHPGSSSSSFFSVADSHTWSRTTPRSWFRGAG
jgi:hypothetical protein